MYATTALIHNGDVPNSNTVDGTRFDSRLPNRVFGRSLLSKLGWPAWYRSLTERQSEPGETALAAQNWFRSLTHTRTHRHSTPPPSSNAQTQALRLRAQDFTSHLCYRIKSQRMNNICFILLWSRFLEIDHFSPKNTIASLKSFKIFYQSFSESFF